jgi:hypothetical protein
MNAAFATSKMVNHTQMDRPGVATFITRLLVRVVYAIFVLDLKRVTWSGPASGSESASTDWKGELP